MAASERLLEALPAVVARARDEIKARVVGEELLELGILEAVLTSVTSAASRAASEKLSTRRGTSSATSCWIAFQTGGQASFVAGFRAWLELGDCVNKGERAIRILAPMTVKKRDADDDEQAEGTRTCFAPCRCSIAARSARCPRASRCRSSRRPSR